jgi:hypothetical protein
MTHLEELIAEYYEWRGYVVKCNALVGKRAKGGWEMELDVVAYDPETPTILHIEPSLDGQSWETREGRFVKKFEAGRKYICPSSSSGCRRTRGLCSGRSSDPSPAGAQLSLRREPKWRALPPSPPSPRRRRVRSYAWEAVCHALWTIIRSGSAGLRPLCQSFRCKCE